MIDCYWLDARRDLKVSEVFHEIVGEIERLKADAALGQCAMHFVDRAGDVHPGIDDAETICADFYKAMFEVIQGELDARNRSTR